MSGDARRRLSDLEERATAGAIRCDACQNGTRPRVSWPEDLAPVGPAQCPACGRPLVRILVQYVDVGAQSREAR